MMLTYNELSYTRKCFQSLFEYTSQVKTPFEVLVHDNGSTDGTVQYLQGLEQSGQIRAIYSPKNLGFPAGHNALARIAKGQFLCLLNNDIIVTEGWLEKLLLCLKSDQRCAAVGPYCNHATGLQASPVKCDYTEDASLKTFAREFRHPDQSVDFLVFFCVLIRRQAWDDVGGLCEQFGIGTYEDNLFCVRVLEKGWTLRMAGSVFVHHFVSRSFGKDPAAYERLLCRNQRIFLKEIGADHSVGLAMIVSDHESPKALKEFLSHIASWLDEIVIVFNYRRWPNPWRYRRLKAIADSFGARTEYVKFHDFSHARNRSLELLRAEYALWLDADDRVEAPRLIRELIWKHPDVDAFKCRINSRTERGTNEVIVHNRLFKNKSEYRFRNACHEDITFSMNEQGAVGLMCPLAITHHGYVDRRVWMHKNRRNYRLLLRDMRATPHALTYYGLINCLIILASAAPRWRQPALLRRAITLCDEAMTKFGLTKDDPLTPKLWVLRGIACLDAGQALAAKQSFHKAYDEWRHPEAAVNLAELYMREKNYEQARIILDTLYEVKEFQMTNISFDPVQVECMMLQKLGDIHFVKGSNGCPPAEKQEAWAKSEKYYREHLSVQRANLHTADRLCAILRQTNRMQEANLITVELVNRWPSYAVGWNNLASTELLAKRYRTARLFLQECLKYQPDHREARHNLEQVERILGAT